MAAVLVTGATGLVGSHVARALVQRGDQVRAGVRKRSRLDNLEGLEAEQVACDVLDRRAVRRALRGVERVFHVAVTTSLRLDPAALARLEVEGARIVLEVGLLVEVVRVVQT